MKISKIVMKPLSEVKELPRFDFNKKIKKQKWFLLPLAWLLALPETFLRRAKITKTNMESLKGKPYILLCNHNAFYDFKVATRAIFPRRATYVVAVDGFIGRETLMRHVGCIGKRKFINDMGLVKQIKRSLYELNHITMIYPEARYSHVGTNSLLPDSLGKLVKLLKVPVVTLISHGHHLSQPVWNLRKRKVRTTAELTQIVTLSQSTSLSVDEINRRINEKFMYDDYAWQKEHNVKIREKFRAEGLEAVLYQCPYCLGEGKHVTHENTISCTSCGETHTMNEYGELTNTNGPTKFSHIPTWYEWQRAQVKKEILSGAYEFRHAVNVNLLQSSKGFYEVGTALLVHNEAGFTITGTSFGEDFVIKQEPLENYSVHVEYNYFGRGHGISFSKGNDTYYMFGNAKTYLVTKAHFAVEELYKIKANINKTK